MADIRKRGFSAKTYYAFNPMPAGYTERHLFERAGLTKDSSEVLDPFVITDQFASQGEAEPVTLVPGDILMLRGEEDKRDIGKLLKDQGIVILDDLEDERTKLERSIAAVRLVQQWHESRGRQLFKRHMMESKIPKDDHDEYKQLHWPYFVSQAKSEILVEHLKTLQADLARVKAAPAPEPSAAKPTRFGKVPAPSGKALARA